MFRFTIRELVLVTVIVALGVGWWVDRRRSSRAGADLVAFQQRATVEVMELRQKGAVLERFLSREGWNVEWDNTARTAVVYGLNRNDDELTAVLPLKGGEGIRRAGLPAFLPSKHLKHAAN